MADVTRRLAPLAAAALCSSLCASLALSGCAMLDKDTKPTRNSSPTRASAEATRGATTSAPPKPTATAAPSTPRTATPSPGRTSQAVVVGQVASLSESGWGAVRFGSPVTAADTVAWLDACQGWALKSSGGTVVGHAKTDDGTQGGKVFAIRIDSTGVAGPSGVKVGAPASEFSAVHPDARSADAGGKSWLWTAGTPTTFTAQLDKKGGTIQALMVLPAGQEAAAFSSVPLCR